MCSFEHSMRNVNVKKQQSDDWKQKHVLSHPFIMPMKKCITGEWEEKNREKENTERNFGLSFTKLRTKKDTANEDHKESEYKCIKTFV